MVKKIVLGVIGSDCHAVANKILDRELTKAGFYVINIGILSPQEDFINAALETGADAIVVSSIYGHAEEDCRGFRQKCDEAGLKDILIYLGGNVSHSKEDFPEAEKKFKEMGFNRVYPPGTDPKISIRDIKKDLNIK